MSDFMQPEITRKGVLYTCECAKCGASLFTHEWAHDDHNERRDAMYAGTLACDQCIIGRADPETVHQVAPSYAGRLSAPGYLDCTDWEFETSLVRLRRSLNAMAGD